jgi:hypothetical protein
LFTRGSTLDAVFQGLIDRTRRHLPMFGLPDMDDDTTRTTFSEYACFRYDPEIGSFTGTPTQRWEALTCHEIAHAIDHGLGETPEALAAEMSRVPMILTVKLKGHGHRWRVIYRLLRRHMGLTSPTRSDGVRSDDDKDARPICDHCGQRFAPKRKVAKTCSPKCRTAAYRQRKRQATS